MVLFIPRMVFIRNRPPGHSPRLHQIKLSLVEFFLQGLVLAFEEGALSHQLTDHGRPGRGEGGQVQLVAGHGNTSASIRLLI